MPATYLERMYMGAALQPWLKVPIGSVNFSHRVSYSSSSIPLYRSIILCTAKSVLSITHNASSTYFSQKGLAS